MKVILALTNEREQAALSKLLTESKFEVLVANEGQSALRQAAALSEPYVALLDRNLPGLTGLQVCLCLRSPKLKVRPYVFILDDRADSGEIARLLNQGADDCLVRPLRAVEVLARIGAAERVLQHHLELQQQVQELETVLKRYDLLGEIVAQTGRNRMTRQPEPKAAAAATAQAGEPPSEQPQVVAEPEPPRIDLTLPEADEIMQRIIRELRFGNVGVLAKVLGQCYATAEVATWAGFILEHEQVWYDLVIEVDRAAMAMIFEQTMGRPPASEQERRDFLVETHTIICAGLKAMLSGRGARVISPVLSRVVPSYQLAGTDTAPENSIRYVLAGGSIAFTLLRQSCAQQRKNVVRLDLFDVTAEDVPPPQENEVPWLCKGAVLTPRFIRKLASFETRRTDRMVIPVFPSSPLATRILRSELSPVLV